MLIHVILPIRIWHLPVTFSAKKVVSPLSPPPWKNIFVYLWKNPPFPPLLGKNSSDDHD